MQLSLLISEMEMRYGVCLQCLILKYSASHIVHFSELHCIVVCVYMFVFVFLV